MGGVNFETSACSGVARVCDTRCGTKNLLTFFCSFASNSIIFRPPCPGRKKLTMTFFALLLATQSFSDPLVQDAKFFFAPLMDHYFFAPLTCHTITLTLTLTLQYPKPHTK